MYFEKYGRKIKWLEPKEFYADSWRIIDPFMKGSDGELYTIVFKDNVGLRYTII